MRVKYQPFYCEENIWHLCAALDPSRRSAARVLVLSNADRTVAVWAQRAAPSADEPVVWDYHVVLLHDGELTDLDSRAGWPIPYRQWLRVSFPHAGALDVRWQPKFRSIPADEYLEAFSSDRRHMRDDAGGWTQPPPDWEPIFDPEKGHTLDRLLDLGQGAWGPLPE